MSVKLALKFIQATREDEGLRDQLKMLGQVVDLKQLVQLGAQAGYDFTLQEMQSAFKHDWGMRWMYYGGGMSGMSTSLTLPVGRNQVDSRRNGPRAAHWQVDAEPQPR